MVSCRNSNRGAYTVKFACIANLIHVHQRLLNLSQWTLCLCARSLGVSGFFEHFDPWANVEAVVVEGATANEVAVDDAGFVDEDASGDFEVELAFGDGGHFAAFDTVGVGGAFRLRGKRCSLVG